MAVKQLVSALNRRLTVAKSDIEELHSRVQTERSMKDLLTAQVWPLIHYYLQLSNKIYDYYHYCIIIYFL